MELRVVVVVVVVITWSSMVMMIKSNHSTVAYKETAIESPSIQWRGPSYRDFSQLGRVCRNPTIPNHMNPPPGAIHPSPKAPSPSNLPYPNLHPSIQPIPPPAANHRPSPK
ncbi:hypothetical protein L873DRAFT_871736 [Choiromyces venosus 120613-1]|uniref:Uncharacterized protein n=1 Tax=Choiromyces venosus 120613-1 TaxID=1336337 RepID=A0A3N4JN51_9PEZI|nr:hypothetical protein L873DRAFT_871736 [Choiromyces venosus 120613-1]